MLQLTARNPYLRPLPPNASEGFAQFFSDLAGITDLHADDRVKEQIASEGTDALTLYRVHDRDDPNSSSVAYASAALYFEFLYETGGDPWDVALRVSDEAEIDLPQIVKDLGPNLSVWEWQAWVEEL